MTARLVICRVCGAQGLEAADDIAPGLCPDCLDRTLARLTEELTTLLRLHSRQEAVARIRDEMIVSGLSPEAAATFLGVVARGDGR